MIPKSPLRYPGGKTRAIPNIAPLLKDKGDICSPFFGGGSIELNIPNRVYGYDNLRPLTVFWNVILNNPSSLYQYVLMNKDITRDKFKVLQNSITSLSDDIEIAGTFFILNRCSYSGATLCSGFSTGTPRFTNSSISRIKEFKSKNIVSVECMCFTESIPMNSTRFLYLDPPYYGKENIYGFMNEKHFNHNALREILSQRDGWVLSYNDCPQIRDMYKDYKITTPQWSYCMNSTKKSKELLILNF